ncbi:MAG: hypothetical protein HC844_18965 [Tabrizicola sp.]|nr:hypothetical protein [Tabrizicola sp.]
MKLLDPNDPFFGKTWVRAVTVLAPLSWAAVEFLYIRDPLWGVIFTAAGAYAAWVLFLARRSEK